MQNKPVFTARFFLVPVVYVCIITLYNSFMTLNGNQLLFQIQVLYEESEE